MLLALNAATSKTKLKIKLDGPHTDPADTELDPLPQTLEPPRIDAGTESASTSSSKGAGGEERAGTTPSSMGPYSGADENS